MIVAIYARVSTAVQAEEGYSIQAQIDDCTKYANTHLKGSTIDSFVDDGYSGAYLERPALERLRGALSAKVYNAVVCYDPDRLARGLSKQLIITEEIEKSGAALHFVNHEYKNTPEGQLFFQIRGAFSGYEREKIKERSMRGKREKLKSGKEIQGTNIPGYRFDKKTSQYVVDEEQANLVRRIFDMYLDGVTGGFAAIANTLNSEGIPTPLGGRWLAASIGRILRNRRYTGKFYAFKSKQIKIGTRKTKTLPRPKEEWIEMMGPAIIPQEIFDQVQEKIKPRSHPHIFHRATDHPYLLTGIACCAVCGQPLGTRNGGASHTKDGKARYYYYCTNKCFNAPQTDTTDDAVWETITKICLDDELLAKYLRADAQQDDTAKELAALKKQLAKSKSQKQTIMAWHLSGAITMDDATQKLRELTEKETALSAKIDMLSGQDKAVSENDIRKAIDEVKAHLDADYVSRRRLIVKFVDKIYLKRTDNYRRKDKTSLRLDIRFK